MPTPLSIFNHVRNEARTLAKSLASIRPIADELVVVDTGSTDETIAIARRYADRVVEWTWRDDFAAASRYAASLCTHRFACKWDGDWWLRESIESIQTLKQAGLKAGSVYHFLWINEFDPETLTPIIRNTRQFIYDRFSYEWVSPIHTHLAPKQGQSLQTITDLSITIYDDKEPLAKQHRYTQTQQLLAHHYAHAFGAERTRLAKYAVLSAFHLEDYEALSLWIEKHGRKYRQLALLDADLAVAKNNLAAAKEKYRLFLKIHPFDPVALNLSTKRFRDHPRQMLQALT